MKRMRTALPLLGMVLVACSPTPLVEAEWENLGEGTSFAAGCQANSDRLLRTESEWASYWDEVHPDSPPERPAVDFSKESVLVTCGPRPDPGHSAAITSVQVAPGPRVASATVTDYGPGENCAYPAVVVYGHHAVKVRDVFSAAEFTHTAQQGPSC